MAKDDTVVAADVDPPDDIIKVADAAMMDIIKDIGINSFITDNMGIMPNRILRPLLKDLLKYLLAPLQVVLQR